MRNALIALSLLAASVARGQDDPKKFEDFKRDALKKEAGGAWKKIGWQKDMDAAIEKAKADTKPILAVLVVGEMAKKDAPEC